MRKRGREAKTGGQRGQIVKNVKNKIKSKGNKWK